MAHMPYYIVSQESSDLGRTIRRDYNLEANGFHFPSKFQSSIQ